MTRASVSAAVKKSLQFLFAVFSLFIYRLEVFADVVILGDPISSSKSISDYLVYLVPILLIVIITVILLNKKRKNKKDDK